MSVRIHTFTLDTPDPFALASWWSRVLERPIAEDDFAGDPEASIALDDHGNILLFLENDDEKVVKNRMHLDLWPSDRTRDEELPRLLELGATLYADHRRDDGSGFVTLQDPEGNEFCLVRSEAERA